MKKGMITLCTIIVVLLGVFIGIKLFGTINKTDSPNVAQNNEVAEAGKIENKDVNEDEFAEFNANEEISESTDEDFQTIKNEEEKEKDEAVEETSEEAITIEVYEDKYVVKKDERLYSIAREVLTKNNLDPEDKVNLSKALKLLELANQDVIENRDMLIEGTKLLIPTGANFDEPTEKIGSAYTIQVGDTLTSIAYEQMPWCSDINTAIDLIKVNNNIESDKILADTTIYIPQEN
jgi:LysM repeat protein